MSAAHRVSSPLRARRASGQQTLPSARSSVARSPSRASPSAPGRVSPSRSSSAGSSASSADGGPRSEDVAVDIPQWAWGGPPPGPGQLLYLKESRSQTWLVALLLGEHPSQTGSLFVAHTNGDVGFIDPVAGDYDECIVTDFDADVPPSVVTGYYEGFSFIPGGGSWDDLLEWGAGELEAMRLGMLRGGGKKAKKPKPKAGDAGRRMPSSSKSGAWERTGGKWYALASIEADVAGGIAAIDVGDIVVPDKTKGMAFGDHGLAFPSYNRAVPVMWVADAHHSSWVKATSTLWDDLVKDLDGGGGGGVPTPTKDAGGGGKDGKDEGADEDIRILPIQIEAADNRRHRRLEDAQPLFVEDDFEDWPLDGDRTMMHGARELRRQGLTFTSHHDKWSTQSGVAQSSRALKEHKVLCLALHYMTTYDQLNLPNIAAAELINLRRQLIESAHEYNPDLPDYTAAEDFMGSHDNARGAIIDPRRVAFVAARQGARAKVLEQSRKAKEERNMYLTRSSTAGKKDDDASGPTTDEKSGRARGKKG